MVSDNNNNKEEIKTKKKLQLTNLGAVQWWEFKKHRSNEKSKNNNSRNSYVFGLRPQPKEAVNGPFKNVRLELRHWVGGAVKPSA